MRRQATLSALLLVTVGIVLGATVFRSDIAQATGLASSVTVNNTAAQAVPVREQNLDGGNIKVHEEGTATVRGAVSPAAPADPVVLVGRLQNYPNPSATITLVSDKDLQEAQTHKLAIGSITISTEGGGASANLYVTLRATNCSGNGLGGIEDITAHGDSTEHLTYPIPEVIPVVDSASYCVIADVLNGNGLTGGPISLRIVGYAVS